MWAFFLPIAATIATGGADWCAVLARNAASGERPPIRPGCAVPHVADRSKSCLTARLSALHRRYSTGRALQQSPAAGISRQRQPQCNCGAQEGRVRHHPISGWGRREACIERSALAARQARVARPALGSPQRSSSDAAAARGTEWSCMDQGRGTGTACNFNVLDTWGYSDFFRRSCSVVPPLQPLK